MRLGGAVVGGLVVAAVGLSGCGETTPPAPSGGSLGTTVTGPASSVPAPVPAPRARTGGGDAATDGRGPGGGSAPHRASPAAAAEVDPVGRGDGRGGSDGRRGAETRAAPPATPAPTSGGDGRE